MQGIVDRFEGDYAVVEFEGRQMKDVSLVLLPAGVREGDVIEYNDQGYSINHPATEQRRRQIAQLADDLWK